MVKIDLNADLGEGGSADAELMTLVTSVNIACGFHAGDAQTMLASVRNAIKNGVAIGAHPSFPDRENFGRTAMDLPPETVYAQTLYQIGALEAIVRSQQGALRLFFPPAPGGYALALCMEEYKSRAGRNRPGAPEGENCPIPQLGGAQALLTLPGVSSGG